MEEARRHSDESCLRSVRRSQDHLTAFWMEFTRSPSACVHSPVFFSRTKNMLVRSSCNSNGPCGGEIVNRSSHLSLFVSL